jgi:hypothetical protein
MAAPYPGHVQQPRVEPAAGATGSSEGYGVEHRIDVITMFNAGQGVLMTPSNQSVLRWIQNGVQRLKHVILSSPPSLRSLCNFNSAVNSENIDVYFDTVRHDSKPRHSFALWIVSRLKSAFLLLFLDDQCLYRKSGGPLNTHLINSNRGWWSGCTWFEMKPTWSGTFTMFLPTFAVLTQHLPTVGTKK